MRLHAFNNGGINRVCSILNNFLFFVYGTLFFECGNWQVNSELITFEIYIEVESFIYNDGTCWRLLGLLWYCRLRCINLHFGVCLSISLPFLFHLLVSVYASLNLSNGSDDDLVFGSEHRLQSFLARLFVDRELTHNLLHCQALSLHCFIVEHKQDKHS